ncbi:hypothetical protein PMIN07_005646 [Paraphaeosphaeria minitans]
MYPCGVFFPWVNFGLTRVSYVVFGILASEMGQDDALHAWVSLDVHRRSVASWFARFFGCVLHGEGMVCNDAMTMVYMSIQLASRAFMQAKRRCLKPERNERLRMHYLRKRGCPYTGIATAGYRMRSNTGATLVASACLSEQRETNQDYGKQLRLSAQIVF